MWQKFRLCECFDLCVCLCCFLTAGVFCYQKGVSRKYSRKKAVWIYHMPLSFTKCHYLFFALLSRNFQIYQIIFLEVHVFTQRWWPLFVNKLLILDEVRYRQTNHINSHAAFSKNPLTAFYALNIFLLACSDALFLLPKGNGSLISQQHYCLELTNHWYLCFTVSTLMQMYLCALITNKYSSKYGFCFVNFQMTDPL